MAILYQDRLDRVFHALGDSTRREMLARLSKYPQLSASELADTFDISQPTASKHIKVLEKSTLIKRDIQGRNHYFSLNAATLSKAEDWISRHKKFWSGSLDQLERFVNELPGDELPKKKQRRGRK